MEDDGGFGDWEEDAPAEEAPAEAAEEAVEGEEGTQEEGTQEETQAEGEEDIPEEELEPQEPERKLFWSKWERPKSHIYDYNYGYFNNYYSGMIDLITSGKHGKPLAESWAERSMRMYSKMKESRKIQASADEDLVRKIRSGHNEFFRHRNELSAKDTGYHRE